LGLVGPAVDGDRMLLAWSKVDIERSPDSLFHLMVERSASASTTNSRCEPGYPRRTPAEDTLLSLPPLYSISRDGRWRDQEIRYVLKVPVVVRSGSMRAPAPLDDIENVSSTWDYEWSAAPGP
jgi:hypothetical protein